MAVAVAVVLLERRSITRALEAYVSWDLGSEAVLGCVGCGCGCDHVAVVAVAVAVLCDHVALRPIHVTFHTARWAESPLRNVIFGDHCHGCGLGCVHCCSRLAS